jgi:hypothetical protein
MPRSRLARLLAVVALLAVPPATCAVAPALQSLIARTERLEMLVASLPAVVVDAHGRTLGPVLGLDYFTYQLEFVSAQTHGTAIQVNLDGLPPFMAEVWSDGLFAPHHTGLKLNFETEDCTGQAWVIDQRRRSLWPVVSNEWHSSYKGDFLYMADLEQPPEVVDIRSYFKVGRRLPWPFGRFEYDERFAEYYEKPCTLISSEPPYHDVYTVRAWPMLLVGNLLDYFEPPYRLVAGEELLEQ